MADLSWLDEPVDENGYFLSAVEEWGAHGIYPPPLCGSPTPTIVALTKAVRGWQTAPTVEERMRHLEEAHRIGEKLAPVRHNLPPVSEESCPTIEERRQRARAFIEEWDRTRGGPPATRASRTS